MTRKEAIEQIKWYFEEDDGLSAEDVTIEAINMAIKALQAEPTHEAEPTHGRLIDVDELLKKYTTCEDIDCDTCPIWECGCDGLLQILKEAPIVKDATGGEDK